MIPMTPDAFASHKVIYPCLVQPFLNGQRILCQAGLVQNADGTTTDSLLVQALSQATYHIFGEKTILDGVLVELDFHFFDVVKSRVPFKERFDNAVQCLRDIKYKFRSPIPVPTRKMFDEKQADDQFNQWLSEGFHGMIYRLGNCYYSRPTTKNKRNINKQLLLRKPI